MLCRLLCRDGFAEGGCGVGEGGARETLSSPANPSASSWRTLVHRPGRRGLAIALPCPACEPPHAHGEDIRVDRQQLLCLACTRQVPMKPQHTNKFSIFQSTAGMVSPSYNKQPRPADCPAASICDRS
jgi:hypothetical protein